MREAPSAGGSSLRVHEVLRRWAPAYRQRFDATMPPRHREGFRSRTGRGQFGHEGLTDNRLANRLPEIAPLLAAARQVWMTPCGPCAPSPASTKG